MNFLELAPAKGLRSPGTESQGFDGAIECWYVSCRILRAKPVITQQNSSNASITLSKKTVDLSILLRVTSLANMGYIGNQNGNQKGKSGITIGGDDFHYRFQKFRVLKIRIHPRKSKEVIWRHWKSNRNQKEITRKSERKHHKKNTPP